MEKWQNFKKNDHFFPTILKTLVEQFGQVPLIESILFFITYSLGFLTLTFFLNSLMNLLTFFYFSNKQSQFYVFLLVRHAHNILLFDQYVCSP